MLVTKQLPVAIKFHSNIFFSLYNGSQWLPSIILFIYLFILPDKFIKNEFLFHIIDISWEAYKHILQYIKEK